MKKIATIGMAIVLAMAVLVGQSGTSPEVQLKAAIHKEQVEGDLKAAVELFKTLAQGANRAVAAQAWLHLGQCYEKLGDAQAAEARKAYERVVSAYADQTAAAGSARTRLAALTVPDTGFSQRKVYSAGEDRWFDSPPSRDGRLIAYAGPGWDVGRIGVQDLQTGRTTQIAVAPSLAWGRLVSPIISPDGTQVTWLATTAENRQLFVARPDGSSSRVVFSTTTGTAIPCDWSPDGRSILFSFGRQLSVLSVPSGEARPLTKPLAEKAGGVLCGRISPDGRSIVFQRWSISGGNSGLRGLSVIGIGGEREQDLLMDQNISNPVWSADGRFVLFSRARDERGRPQETLAGSELWALPVKDGKADGPAELIRKDVSQLLGVTASGDYYYRYNSYTDDVYAVEVDPATGRRISAPQQLTSRYRNHEPSLSPDGRVVAYARSTPEPELVFRTLADGIERTLLPAGLPAAWVRGGGLSEWSIDGRFLIYRVVDEVFKIDVESGQSTRVLARSTPRLYRMSNNNGRVRLSKDGQAIFYTATDAKTQLASLYSRRLDGSPATELYRGGERIQGPSLSPDGTSLVFTTVFGFGTSDEYWAVMTLPATGGRAREVCRIRDLTSNPVWSPDGRRIYYSRHNYPPREGQSPDIWSVAVDGTDARPLNLGLHMEYGLDVSPDGRRLVFLEENWRNELWAMRNILPPAKK